MLASTGVRLPTTPPRDLGHGEYRCLSERGILAKLPSALSYAEAATVPNGALTALAYLRNLAALQPQEHVLIYGASGAVGTAAVQLAKAMGATVTGVCSTGNLSLVQSLGADHVIDYTKRDFRRKLRATTSYSTPSAARR